MTLVLPQPTEPEDVRTTPATAIATKHENSATLSGRRVVLTFSLAAQNEAMNLEL